MTPAFPSRRRAEQFEQLLAGTVVDAPTPELTELLALAGQLRTRPEVQPRAEFAASLRERLMAEAPAALTAPAAASAADRLTVGRRDPAKGRRDRRVGLAAVAFSVVGATTASAMASQGALPGDTLYPVKRLLEGAHTALAMGDQAKADTLLAQARGRLQETRTLGQRGDAADAAAIAQALADFRGEARQAAGLVLADYADDGHVAPVDELRAFDEQSIAALDALTALLPPTLDDELADTTQTLLTIDSAAARACPSCDAAGIVELPASLVALLGDPAADAAETAAPTTAAPRPRKPHTATTGTRKPGTGTAPSLPDVGDLGSGATGTVGLPQVSEPGSGSASVGGVVGGVGGTAGGAVSGVGGTVSGTGDAVGGAVGGAVSGAGGTVSGTGDAVGGTVGSVGGTVDGVVGGLLGGLTGTQTPTP